MFFKIWNILFIFVLCGCTSALTDEEAKQQFMKFLLKCTKQHQVEMADLLALQKFIVPTKPEVKCLLACTYRSVGTLDSAGKYDIKVAYEIAEKMKEGDDTRVENARKMADTCVKVNDVSTNDGEKGCERAVLIFKCMIENAPKYGFKIN